MKTKTLLSTTILLGLVACMTACGGGGNKEPAFDKESIKYSGFDYTSTYRDVRISGMGMRTEPFSKQTRTIDAGTPLETQQTKYVVSDVGAFVVPVEFTDFPSSSLPKGSEGSRKDIEDAVFGDGTATGWESLKSFYNKSSFGQCNITGVVTPWFKVNAKSTDFAKQWSTDGSDEVGRQIYEYYTTGAGKGQYNMKDFDKNGDGNIDSLIMIYTPNITTTGELWWAFCSSFNSGATDVNNPSFYRFFWASYKFFYEGKSDAEIANGTAKPDPHTLCHEFGHVLSLPDYYSTDYDATDYAGLGCLDMMDNNIGDHNAFSKSLYGWVEPYVIPEKKTTITINSTTNTGEYFVVPVKGKEFNTALDQYVMVEFLTPTGVAEKDGKERLNGHYPLYYSIAGVRITLIDARLGIWRYINQKGWEFSNFTTRIGTGSGMYVGLACDNTNSRSCYKGYKICEVIPATGKAISSYGGKPQNQANNTFLWQEGQVFNDANGVWQDYQVHGNAGKWDIPFGYSISVDKINGNENATFTITPLE